MAETTLNPRACFCFRCNERVARKDVWYVLDASDGMRRREVCASCWSWYKSQSMHRRATLTPGETDA